MIIIGFDPGASHVGWAILRAGNGIGGTVRISHVNSGSFDVGHSVARSKPRKIKGRSPIVNETIVDDSDLYDLRDVLGNIDLGNEKDCAIIGIERVRRVVPSKLFSANIATSIAISAWIGGEIAGFMRERGHYVRTFTAGEARQSLVGGISRTGGVDDATIAAHVKLAIWGWPARSNAHERDAAVVALYAARQVAR